MGNTWVTRSINTNQYSKFACEGYIIEVIPDVSKNEFDSILVYARSINKVVSNKCSDLSNYVDSGYMKINFGDVDINTFDPISSAEYENFVFDMIFKAVLAPTYWSDGKLVEGTLRVSICSKDK